MSSNSTGDWTLASVIVMGSFLSFIILVGVIGNILVIIVSVQGKRVKTRGKSLIASMACADMLESLNMIFMLATVSMYGAWIFGDAACIIHGFVTTEFVVASMYSLMTVSINRYFMVVKSSQYNKIFRDRNLVFMIAFIWLFPLVFSVSPLIGWSRYDFQPNKATCIFYFSTSISFSVSLMALSVPLPLSIIMFCCYKIFKQVKQHQNRIESMAGQSQQVNVEEIRITKTLIIIILAYLICFIPPATVNLIEMFSPDYKIPFWVDIITMNLLFANHANNPVIYGLFNRQYRRAFKELLLGLMPGVHYTSEGSTAGNTASSTVVRTRATKSDHIEHNAEEISISHSNALPGQSSIVTAKDK